MKNKLKLLILTAATCMACQKEIELKINSTESKLVVNAWFKAGQHPMAQVSRSVFIFDNSQTDVFENAEVLLYENDEEIGYLNHYSGGFYRNDEIVIKPDAVYKITARVEGFEEVISAETTPVSINVEDFTFDHKTVESASTVEPVQSEITISIQDDAATDDFYLFLVKEVQKRWENTNPADTVTTAFYVDFESSDMLLEPIYVNSIGQMILLKDDFFNGSEKTVRFKANDLRRNVYSEGPTNIQSNSIFEIHKISRSFYLYLVSIELNQFPDPFTEPTQIYSNVENGYGILATSAGVEVPVEESRE